MFLEHLDFGFHCSEPAVLQNRHMVRHFYGMSLSNNRGSAAENLGQKRPDADDLLMRRDLLDLASRQPPGERMGWRPRAGVAAPVVVF